jgi:endonuclease/exonuclease/phosphatase family metal-dependent hydrolase
MKLSARLCTAFGLLLAGAVLTACSETKAPPAEPTPAAAATIVVPSGEPATVTLKLLSYNLLYGAGAESRFDANIPARFHGRDKLDEVIDFFQAAAPDVIAVQEAGGWDTGDPSVAEQIAERLGMNYVIAHDAWELHIMLFSRYPILESAYVSRDQDFNGVLLRATLAVTPEARIHVLVTHLNSMSRETRACQLDALLNVAAALPPGPVLLAGDMNFRPTSMLAETLTSHSWQLLVAQESWPIDQVWAGPETSVTTGDWWPPLAPPTGVSDHDPVGIDVTIEAPRIGRASDLEAGTTVPKTLDYACPLP